MSLCSELFTGCLVCKSLQSFFIFDNSNQRCDTRYIVHNLYLACDVATSRSAHLKMCCWLVGCVQFYVGKHCRMCVRLFISNCIMFFKMPKFIVYCRVYMNIKSVLLRFDALYYKEKTLKHNCYVKQYFF